MTFVFSGFSFILNLAQHLASLCVINQINQSVRVYAQRAKVAQARRASASEKRTL